MVLTVLFAVMVAVAFGLISEKMREPVRTSPPLVTLRQQWLLAATWVAYVALCCVIYFSLRHQVHAQELTKDQATRLAMIELPAMAILKGLPAGILFLPYAPRHTGWCLLLAVGAAISVEAALIASQYVMPSVWGEGRYSRNDGQGFIISSVAFMIWSVINTVWVGIVFTLLSGFSVLSKTENEEMKRRAALAGGNRGK